MSIVVARSPSDWVAGLESTGRRAGSRLDASLPWLVSRAYLHATKYVAFLWVVTTLQAIIVVILDRAPYWALVAPVLVCGPAYLAAASARMIASAPGIYFLKQGVQVGPELVGWARVRSFDINQRSLRLVYATGQGVRTVRRTVAFSSDHRTISLMSGPEDVGEASVPDSYR